MRLPYVETEEIKGKIEGIQNEIRKAGNDYIRITGEAGVGKTRLVFEATKAEDLQPFSTFLTTLQYAGILSIMMSIISSTIIVAKVRYSPFGAIIMIVLYFVGIFMSMVFSNAYTYMSEVMTQMIPSFSVLPYLDWMALNLPYINAVVGGIMFFLAYSKTPFKQSSNQGFSFDR